MFCRLVETHNAIKTNEQREYFVLLTIIVVPSSILSLNNIIILMVIIVLVNPVDRILIVYEHQTIGSAVAT
jgi:hypothetical protein